MSFLGMIVFSTRSATARNVVIQTSRTVPNYPTKAEFLLPCRWLKVMFNPMVQSASTYLRDFRLPPQSRWELRSCGLFTQRVVVIPYRRFGTAYRSPLQMSRIVCHDVVIGICGALHQPNTEDRYADVQRDDAKVAWHSKFGILLVVRSDYC
jgi:hypothetical protein